MTLRAAHIIGIDMTNDLIITEQSFERHQNVKRLCGDLERTFLDLGAELFWIENDKDYLNLGHDTFNSYLADPDVTIGRTMAFMAKEVFSTYVLGMEIPSSTVELLEAGVSKLYKVRDEVTQDNKWDIISDCCTLSRTDLGKKYGKAIGRPGGNNSNNSYTLTLPIYTSDRMENTARHAVMSSYPNADDKIQTELTKFATDLLTHNVSSETQDKNWKRLTRIALKARRGWKRIALRLEDENATLKTENASQFQEIVELNQKLDALDDPVVKDDKDWREKILEDY
jgi:hypothetical protein